MAKILVVDDETDLEVLIKQKFRKQIRQQKYEFFFAINGKDALEKLSDQPDVDIVLSDINMPEMSGMELVKKVREMDSCKDLKIVMVSTESAQDLIDGVIADGANGFITKPFTPEKFKEELSSFMN